MYRPGWAEDKIRLPVVIKRTFKTYEQLSRKRRAELEKQGKDPQQGTSEYYAVLSLMGLYPRTVKDILEFRQLRGQIENMIKERKLSYDLRHFPCKKMLANNAFALFGMMAHNFFRLVAILDCPTRPQLAKALGHKFIEFPGRIVRGQGKQYLRIAQIHFKEVQTLHERWLEAVKGTASPQARRSTSGAPLKPPDTQFNCVWCGKEHPRGPDTEHAASNATRK